MSSPHVLSDLSAAQRQRLAYIEFRVWFYGEVARKDVLERFEVATAAGTRDMALYRELAPLNVTYERKAYRYLPTFTPLFHHTRNPRWLCTQTDIPLHENRHGAS